MQLPYICRVLGSLYIRFGTYLSKRNRELTTKINATFGKKKKVRATTLSFCRLANYFYRTALETRRRAGKYVAEGDICFSAATASPRVLPVSWDLLNFSWYAKFPHTGMAYAINAGISVRSTASSDSTLL